MALTATELAAGLDPTIKVWNRVDAYAVRTGIWTVCRVGMGGYWRAELWRQHPRKPYGKRIRSFATSGEAIAYAEKIAARAQHLHRVV